MQKSTRFANDIEQNLSSITAVILCQPIQVSFLRFIVYATVFIAVYVCVPTSAFLSVLQQGKAAIKQI